MSQADDSAASLNEPTPQGSPSGSPPSSLNDRLCAVAAVVRKVLVPTLSVVLCVFTLVEVNHPMMQPDAAKALFVMIGLVLCFILCPLTVRLKDNGYLRMLDLLLAAGSVVCCGYIITQIQPLFESLWVDGQPISTRVSQMSVAEFWLGAAGILLVLEGTRRSIGWAVPILSTVFMLYAYLRPELPSWLLPFSGESWDNIVEKCFLQNAGVFGLATGVMFKYVFLFVVFGAFLEATGGTQFIINFAEAVFGRTPGGPAKVSVLGSGLMGSLSGSAVANAVTTGAFTIPMMRNAGFQPHIAGGITAAAASGGALVPPVMGAAAYMMLDIGIAGVESFLQIALAALIPAVLYYLSVFLIVHFYSKRVGNVADDRPTEHHSIPKLLASFEGVVFFGALISLIGALAPPFQYSPSRAVTISLGVIFVLGLIHPRKKITPSIILEAFVKSAKNGVSLVAASACVGIIIGIVDLTGVAQAMGAEIKSVVESNLLLALIGIMGCSIVLGMGVPSVVCYLLMATLMGSLLSELGVIPLAAHLFIFYFGMMSMVTPPVALAAYASASIAGSNVMTTSWAAFRFSLVGFTLPYMFIYQPALLLLKPGSDGMGESIGWGDSGTVALAVFVASVGIVALAAGIAGFFMTRLTLWTRVLLFISAAMLLSPDITVGGSNIGPYVNISAGLLFLVIATLNWRAAAQQRNPAPAEEPA